MQARIIEQKLLSNKKSKVGLETYYCLPTPARPGPALSCYCSPKARGAIAGAPPSHWTPYRRPKNCWLTAVTTVTGIAKPSRRRASRPASQAAQTEKCSQPTTPSFTGRVILPDLKRPINRISSACCMRKTTSAPPFPGRNRAIEWDD